MPQFLILANDHTDSEALNRRLAVREDHFARVRIEKANGNFIIGGAKLTDEGKMNGSMLLVDFPTIDDVYEWLNGDPYVTNNVWEHYEVIPFRIADV